MFAPTASWSLWSQLSGNATEQLVHAFMTFKLDMGNSLLFGLLEYQINRLQKIQNHATRLVTKTPGHMHITVVVKHLHWLLIRQRVEYKLFLHVHRALPFKAQAASLILYSSTSRPDLCAQLLSYSLWMQGHIPNLGTEPFLALRLDCGTYSLPISVRRSTYLRTFKQRLKAYRFAYAFGDI